MDIKDSLVLKNIPEYLLKVKQDTSGLHELLETVEPNSITLVAGLMDKILSELKAFNHWTDYNDYIKEFRLDEVFEGLEKGFYDVKNPELLEGLFSFKGTSLDVKYLLKVAGLDMEIYDSDYYRKSSSPSLLMFSKYSPFFDNILETVDPEAMDTIFRSNPNLKPTTDALDPEDFTGYIERVNNLTVIKVDNNAGRRVLGYAIQAGAGGDGQAESLAAVLGIIERQFNVTFNDIQLALFPLLLQDYLEAQKAIQSNIDCSLTADITVDLDSPSYEGFTADGIREKIIDVVTTRILVCVYLRLILLSVSTKTYYNPKDKTYGKFNLLIEKGVRDYLDAFPALSVDNITPFLVDNETPYAVPGKTTPTYINDEFLLDHQTETLDPVYVTNARSRYLMQVRNTAGWKVDNNTPVKVWGSDLNLTVKVPLYVTRVNNNANWKVYNTEPRKVVGQSSFVSGSSRKDGSLAEGIYDVHLLVETNYDFGVAFPKTKVTEVTSLEVDLDQVYNLPLQTTVSDYVIVETLFDLEDTLTTPSEEFSIESTIELLNPLYSGAISVGRDQALRKGVLLDAVVSNEGTVGLSIKGFI